MNQSAEHHVSKAESEGVLRLIGAVIDTALTRIAPRRAHDILAFRDRQR